MLEYVDQIAVYTRDMLDDPDSVFLPNSRLARFLGLAYNEFKQKCPAEAFERTYQPPVLANVNALDLSAALFGATPTAGFRMQRPERVMNVDAAGNFISLLTPVSSFETLAPSPFTAQGAAIAYGARWWLDGQILRFNIGISGYIQIVCSADDTVNWNTAIVPGANVYLDNLVRWHDVIALLATQHYAGADGQMQMAIRQKLLDRLTSMQEEFSQTRSGRGSRYVQEEY